MARVEELELELGLPPRRLRRTHAHGWTAPAGAIYVGRPSPYANRWRVVLERGPAGRRHIVDHPAPPNGRFITVTPTKLERVELVARHAAEPISSRLLEELRGHDLICWCPLDEPCHADTLLELANMTPDERLRRAIALDRYRRGITP